MTTLRVGVAGLGRAGGAVVRECLAAPPVELVGAWNRGPVDRDLAEALGPLLTEGGAVPPAGLQRCDLLLLAVSDRAVPEVAGSLHPGADTAVVHLSGAADATLLAALPTGHPGCWHPLQSFAAGRPPTGAPPYAVALQGSPVAVERGRSLARALGHPAVELPAGGRAAYHAAAVLASNCLVALQAAATRTMRSAGVTGDEAWQLLWPLVAGTLANLGESGPTARSLTGPVARGDAETVRRNLTALADDARARAIYASLGEEAIALAVEAGLDPSLARDLTDLLG